MLVPTFLLLVVLWVTQTVLLGIFYAQIKTEELKNTTEDFKPDQVDKYTVVIWLEGWDPECIDNIKGGVVKMSMNFKVLEND